MCQCQKQGNVRCRLRNPIPFVQRFPDADILFASDNLVSPSVCPVVSLHDATWQTSPFPQSNVYVYRASQHINAVFPCTGGGQHVCAFGH